MSGNEDEGEPAAADPTEINTPSDVINQIAAPSDVVEELNFIENALNQLSGGDEYLEAILQNQRLQLLWMLQQQATGAIPASMAEDGFTDQELPLNAIGIANGRIYENDTGRATFQLQGSVFSSQVKTLDEVTSGTPVRVVGAGNQVVKATDVALSLLGLSGSIGSASYNRAETETDVTVQPGEQADVLIQGVDNADWVSVGTNDETHTLYQYLVDGEELVDEPLKEPLGLYNSPYQFPTPISAERDIRVRVIRQQSASGPADFYSKITYFE